MNIPSRHSAFASFSVSLRTRLAEYLSDCRKKDREQLSGPLGWYSQERDWKEYRYELGIMEIFFAAWIKRRLKETPLIQCLEIGVGRGRALQELVQQFPKVLRFESLGLSYRDSLKPWLTRQRVGLAECYAFTECYDLILSVRGGLVYSLNSFAALEGILNALKPGGIAWLQDSRLLLPKEWFRTLLEVHKYPVEVSHYEMGRPVSFKISRNNSERLDLGVYKQRYSELILSRQDFFVEWGFDRVKPGSPLNQVLSFLYEKEHYLDLG